MEHTEAKSICLKLKNLIRADFETHKVMTSLERSVALSKSAKNSPVTDRSTYLRPTASTVLNRTSGLVAEGRISASCRQNPLVIFLQIHHA